MIVYNDSDTNPSVTRSTDSNCNTSSRSSSSSNGCSNVKYDCLGVCTGGYAWWW